MALKKLPIAILISGRGSNMQAIIKAAANPDYPAHIALVISNVDNAGGLNIAAEHGIKTCVINHKNFTARADFDAAMDAVLMEHGIELVCLAGFMRLLSPWFAERWRDKLINIHPSLLPAFKGLHTHKAALETGVKLHGCSVHFVRPDLDAGPIIIQAAVPVMDDDNEESLAARVLQAEHKIYPAAIVWIAEGRVNVIDEKVMVLGAGDTAHILVHPTA